MFWELEGVDGCHLEGVVRGSVGGISGRRRAVEVTLIVFG